LPQIATIDMLYWLISKKLWSGSWCCRKRDKSDERCYTFE